MKLNLKDLKKWMWIEVCEGDDEIKVSNKYKKVCDGIGDEEVSGGWYIWYFYLILDRLVEKEMIEFEGGDFDWIYEFLILIDRKLDRVKKSQTPYAHTNFHFLKDIHFKTHQGSIAGLSF
jgi:hypothetical protein